MEEEEPTPSLPPVPHGPIPPTGNGYYQTDLKDSFGGPNSFLQGEWKPPVPRGKPTPPARPQSMHNLNSYPNGSIITQINDQDGYRATRTPIDSQSRKVNDDFHQIHNNSRIINGSNKLMDNSEQIVNGIHHLNNLNNNPNIMEKPVPVVNSNRYSYPNPSAGADGVRLKNLFNKNNETVGNIVARFNGSATTSPNGNSDFQGTFVQNTKKSNLEANVNSRDEVSTEL